MQKDETQQNKPGFLTSILSIAATGLILYGTFKLLTDGNQYLKDNNADTSKIKKASVELFIKDSRNKDLTKRLKKINKNLRSSCEVDNESGALLLCYTYESVIREYCKKKGVLVKDNESILSLAKKLRPNKIISREEYDEIKTFVHKYRNPVMHGMYDKADLSIIQNNRVFNSITKHPLILN